jgi:hypothetical protein
MFKVLLIAGWGIFAVDAIFVVVSIISRNMGDDAAGHGVALAFGLIALVVVLLGGTGLVFSQRAHSALGVAGSTIPLALPLLFLFGGDIEAYIHRIKSGFEDRKIGRYPDPAQRDLARAIDAVDLARMRTILSTHPNLNGRDEAGFDLLSYAAGLVRGDSGRTDRVEAIRLLLDAGMDPNQSKDNYGGSTFVGTASSVSTPTGHGWVTDPTGAEIFRLFLEHGANPNALHEKQPVLFEVWGSPESVRALLDHGADMNLRDENGDTALLFYLFNARWDAALIVLERGADIHVQNNFGTTPESAVEEAHRREADGSKPEPETYTKVKAALERRRAAEGK